MNCEIRHPDVVCIRIDHTYRDLAAPFLMNCSFFRGKEFPTGQPALVEFIWRLVTHNLLYNIKTKNGELFPVFSFIIFLKSLPFYVSRFTALLTFASSIFASYLQTSRLPSVCLFSQKRGDIISVVIDINIVTFCFYLFIINDNLFLYKRRHLLILEKPASA